MRRLAPLLALLPAAVLAFGSPTEIGLGALREDTLHVDPKRGDDDGDGTARHPLRSLSAAIARLSDPVERTVTIQLAAGEYETTGGRGMPERSLHLMARMRPDVSVRIVGPKDGKPAVLAWKGDRRMVEVREGEWRLANVQIGSFRKDQRRGVTVAGPGHVVLQDVTFELRSNSDAGIWARDGGRASLRGAIRLNAHVHEKAPDESFCGLLATDHGVIEFDEKSGSSLSIGNGNVAVRYYGSIRLGCDEVRVSSWTKSNNLSINSGGRIDMHGSRTYLRTHQEGNSQVGLEHDGHLLAEDAHLTLEGSNRAAIVLQKSSTFTCNDIELAGKFEIGIKAMSGSMFVGRFIGDVPALEARTGATIHIEKLRGKKVGEITVESGGMVTLPDRTLHSD